MDTFGPYTTRAPRATTYLPVGVIKSHHPIDERLALRMTPGRAEYVHEEVLHHPQVIDGVEGFVERQYRTGTPHAIPRHLQFVHGVYVRNVEFHGRTPGHHEVLLLPVVGGSVGGAAVDTRGFVGVRGPTEPKGPVLAALAALEEEDRVASPHLGDLVDGGAVSATRSTAGVILACHYFVVVVVSDERKGDGGGGGGVK